MEWYGIAMADERVESAKIVRRVLIAAAVAIVATFAIEQLESIAPLAAWLTGKKSAIPSRFADFILLPPVTWTSRFSTWFTIGAIAYQWPAPAVDSALFSSF